MLDMKINFLLILFLYLFAGSNLTASQFNYGSDFAAISPNAHKALINALEKSGDRIFEWVYTGLLFIQTIKVNRGHKLKQCHLQKH